MATIYNTPLSTASEKALFGRPGGVMGGCMVIAIPLNVEQIIKIASCGFKSGTFNYSSYDCPKNHF